jgi:glyoxylase-like metal-dependent hydrolase (beta-lactamase superfamily II)
MGNLKIHPLNLGTITRPKLQFCFEFSELFNMVDVPLIAWYIEGADRKILVDAGGEDAEEVTTRTLYKQTADQKIEAALRRLGLRCEDIDLVVNTHLHWDHCGGNGRFPQAEFIVQEEELRMARDPLPLHAAGYSSAAVRETRFTTVKGHTEIVPGVSAIFTPGHSTGLQGVLVEGKTQKYFVCSDTVGLFECLKRDPPVVGAIYVDLRDYYASLKKISGLGAVLLPGHDPKVFDRDVYC